MKFLGYIVSSGGLETDGDKVRAIAEWPTPHSVTEVKASVEFVPTTESLLVLLLK